MNKISSIQANLRGYQQPLDSVLSRLLFREEEFDFVLSKSDLLRYLLWLKWYSLLEL